MNSIYLFTNIAPHYRKALWLNLLESKKTTFHFYYGENPLLDIQSIGFSHPEFITYKKQLHLLKNVWYKGKVLLWQKGVIKQCLTGKFKLAIFLGEFYCISTWLAAIICRMRGIKVAFWGHGLYGNEGKLKLFLRKTFYRLANGHLLYERRAKQLMIKEGFNKETLYVIFNSLDYDQHKELRKQFNEMTKSDIFPFLKNPSLPILIFIGRLTQIKKLEILVQSVIKINGNEPRVNLVIIGDGPIRANLEKLSCEEITSKTIHFIGACYEEEEIGRYLFGADLCVSPGNIGLTAIHSLSFGTPICTHSNLINQMPEAESITDGFNGFYFDENNIIDLIEKINNWLAINKDRESVRIKCYSIIDQYYNPYYQLSVLNRLFKNESPEI